MTHAGRRIAAFLTAGGVFALDRWSKWLVEMRIGPADTKIVIPGFFNIVRSENPGVAFGIFAGQAGRSRTPLLIAISILAVAILAAMLWRIERKDGYTTTGLALIFGGALGNVFDRIRDGAVTDFLDFYAASWHWYTFNIADASICIGAGLLIVSMLLSNRHVPAH
jgi:signal peptidase II